jgi:uncharacterized protein
VFFVQRHGEEGAMKLDLTEIAHMSGSHAVENFSLELKDIDGDPLTAPVTGQLTAESSGQVLLLHGYADTEVELSCARCGVLYRQPVHVTFQEDFEVRPPQLPGHGPLVIEEEPPEARLFVPGTLDLVLDELLRQNIVLALPLKPLCDTACPGLCPQCGQRLSEGPCRCVASQGDPRFVALASLLDTSTNDAHRNEGNG